MTMVSSRRGVVVIAEEVSTVILASFMVFCHPTGSTQSEGYRLPVISTT